MSRDALAILRSLGLLDRRNRVSDSVQKLEPMALRERIRYYRKRRAAGIVSVTAQNATEALQPAALFSSLSARTSLDLVLPAVCGFDRLYLDDRLFAAGDATDEFTRAHRQTLGGESDDAPNPASLRRMLSEVAALAPLIEARLVELCPLTTARLPADRPRSIYYSEDGFASAVPTHLREFVHAAARVREVRPLEDKLVVMSDPPRQPVRGINVAFDGDDSASRNAFYVLQEMEGVTKEDDTTYRFAMRLDWTKPVEPGRFEAWVAQSINRTVIDRLNMVSREIRLAAMLNASYLTQSSFEATLFGMSAAERSPGSPVQAVNFLRANLGDLVLPSPSRLVALRSNEPRLFEEFQASLRHASMQLVGLDGDEYAAQARRVLANEIRPRVDSLRTAFQKLIAGGIGGILTAAGTLSLALAGSAVPLAALLVAGVGTAAGVGVPAIPEYTSARKGAAFIWSELLRK